MFRLLLDEHLARSIAEQLAKHRPEVNVRLLADWHDGALLGQPNSEILEAAVLEGLTFVSCDKGTITPLLVSLADEGKSHGGVILIPTASFPQSNLGAVVRALVTLSDTQGELDWANRVAYLARPVH